MRSSPHERSSRRSYVNHAHNDWLELWLTGGAPAIVLAVGFLAWLAASTFRLWSTRPTGDSCSGSCPRAGSADRDCFAAIALGGGLPIANRRTQRAVRNGMCLFNPPGAALDIVHGRSIAHSANVCRHRTFRAKEISGREHCVNSIIVIIGRVSNVLRAESGPELA